jgi:PAS domain S-box-containing protein
MMRHLRNLRLKRKLMLVILLSCGASAVAATVALFVFQTATMRSSFQRDLDTLTEVLASQCAGPVMFRDASAARDVLGSLKARPEIVSGQIHLADGTLFAETVQDSPGQHPPRSLGGWLKWLRPPELSAEHPVAWQDNQEGRLALKADYTRTYRDLTRLSLGFLSAVLIGSLGVGFLVSSVLQGVISVPITRLASTARKIAEEKDYSVRAASTGTDEVGALTEAFNQMLERIHSDATSLLTMNRDLVQEVSDRRRAERALQESEARYRTVFENATIGIYRIAADGRMLLANPALVTMLGYGTVAELQAASSAGFYLDPKDHARFHAELKAKAEVKDLECLWRKRNGENIWIRENARLIVDQQSGIAIYEGVVEDVTARKSAEAQQRLIEVSRLAGKAEVATGVLHNVGNVLNSVSVSAGLLLDRAIKSKIRSLEKTAALVRENLDAFSDYVRSDPKGQLIPEFLCKLSDHLVLEQAATLQELKALVSSVEHVKEIVAMQQSYAKVSGVLESLAPRQLVEDALRLNEIALQRHGIRIEREFATVPFVLVDRHKVIQILINLIRNAKYALETANCPDKCLRLEIGANGSGRVHVIVRDNGVGIAPENLTKIFSHGFTTKREGHGFGLHSGALAAKEMGGTLQAASEGLGRGAAFTLELPIVKHQNATSCTTET